MDDLSRDAIMTFVIITFGGQLAVLFILCIFSKRINTKIDNIANKIKLYEGEFVVTKTPNALSSEDKSVPLVNDIGSLESTVAYERLNIKFIPTYDAIDMA